MKLAKKLGIMLITFLIFPIMVLGLRQGSKADNSSNYAEVSNDVSLIREQINKDPLKNNGAEQHLLNSPINEGENELSNTEKTANDIPETDNSALQTFNASWWDYDSNNNVITIHPHELNAETDARLTSNKYYWPWTYYTYNQAQKIIIEPGVTAKGTLENLFNNMNYCTSIEGLENLDTSEVTNMNSMFKSCNQLTSMNLSSFNTSKVIDMSSMFYNCRLLNNVDISTFNTSKATNMTYMFGLA